MTSSIDQRIGRPWHEWVKYSVYGLLALNIALFFREEWQATAYTFDGAVSISEVISTFAASIDTAAWVVLLLLFELETYQLPPDRITPRLAFASRLLRTGCYGFILYAFYGYLTKALGLYAFVPTSVDPCLLAAEGYSVLIRLDEYVALDVATCGPLTGSAGLYLLSDSRILAEPEVLDSVRRLAWVDVVNSATWILIVALLEFDIWLRVRGRLAGLIEHVSMAIKLILYAIVFAAVVYWGIAGNFIDFWDAFLWLFAFVFIEMNVFGWNE